MAAEKFTFQAEVSKLLDIVAHSLYSRKEIFLRELISNASDACDRLRYMALSEPKLTAGDAGFRIDLRVDAKAGTLTVSDNGIGMNRDELAEMLGTIARSGTQAFVERIKADDAGGVALIGQFGVGFYSAFMVADKVEVASRKAGDKESWLWSSDGKGEFTIDAGRRDGRGTDVVLHLNAKEREFLEPLRIETVVKRYSDHVGIPIMLKGAGDSQEKTLNTAEALWTRDKKTITEAQYKEFYHHVGHGFDEPWMTLHNRVEGVVSYTNLLFIPASRPFDLFHADRKPRVRLYVKRVFIADDCEGLLPSYLRFVRGVVDSEDLPLNISREMLQRNPQLAKIRSGLVKRIFGQLKKTAEKKPDHYAVFWDNFGAVLKEGLYEDFENRDAILPLVRFRSTAGDGLVGLDDYVGRMKAGQDAIYTVSGDDAKAALMSPQLEAFKAKGVEVLLMTDPIDEFWMSAVPRHRDKPFKSATRGAVDLDAIQSAGAGADGTVEDSGAKPANKPDPAAMAPLLAQFKTALGDTVKDVRASARLIESPVCLVADEGDMDIHLERMLKRHRHMDAAPPTPRVLEVNPEHPLIQGLARRAAKGTGQDPAIAEAALLLFDQARIVEGEPVADPLAFARRLAAAIESGLKGGA